MVDVDFSAAALREDFFYRLNDPKLVAELDKKLDQAKEKLLEGNVESTPGKLKSFIKEVEPISKRRKSMKSRKSKRKKN